MLISVCGFLAVMCMGVGFSGFVWLIITYYQNVSSKWDWYLTDYRLLGFIMYNFRSAKRPLSLMLLSAVTCVFLVTIPSMFNRREDNLRWEQERKAAIQEQKEKKKRLHSPLEAQPAEEVQQERVEQTSP
ncbi:MAG: hypothetical protein R3C11_28995 [Planctomycetaceae bacterium]